MEVFLSPKPPSFKQGCTTMSRTCGQLGLDHTFGWGNIDVVLSTMTTIKTMTTTANISGADPGFWSRGVPAEF